MKKLFFLCTMLLASVVMFAETETFTWTSNMGTALSGTKQDSGFEYVTDNFTLIQKKGSSSTNVANSYAQMRCYVGHTLTITGGVNVESIQGLKITLPEEDKKDSLRTESVSFSPAAVTIVDGTTLSISGTITELTITFKKQVRLTAIEFTYTKAEITTPTIQTSPTVVPFGGHLKGATIASKEVKVTGYNLNDAITATVSEGAPFTATGTLTKDGGTLTIACTATTGGKHTGTLKLTSGAASAEVELSVEILATTGAGTQDNPFTVADVLTLKNQLTGSYWVKGYILGSVSNGPVLAEKYSDSNIALGDTKDASAIIGVGIVNTETDSAKAELNLVAHSENLRASVKVYGSLENYYSGPGVKSVSKYADLTIVDAKEINLVGETTTVNQYYEKNLLASVNPAEGVVLWTSEFDTVATVVDGLVTALRPGVTTITAKSHTGAVEKKCVVTVTAAPETWTCEYLAGLAISPNKKITLTGYVTSIDNPWNEENKNISFYVADEKDGGEVFLCFRAKPAGETVVIAKEGDKVTLQGYVGFYNHKAQLAQGGTYTIIEQATTALENTTTEEVKARKVVENGQIFILKDGVKYNIFGAVAD